ncbi:MAG: hypothetical protein Q7K26_01305 [bacterium]|nr:hypothetical protein [bacterium]
MIREVPVDPAKALYEAAGQRNGFIGLIGTVNAGKTPLLNQLTVTLKEIGNQKVMYAELLADARVNLEKFLKSDCTVLVLREFRDISKTGIHQLLEVSQRKTVVAGLHPGCEHAIVKANFGVPVRFIELLRPDDLSPNEAGAA